jgi:hypothetical protein
MNPRPMEFDPDDEEVENQVPNFFFLFVKWSEISSKTGGGGINKASYVTVLAP